MTFSIAVPSKPTSTTGVADEERIFILLQGFLTMTVSAAAKATLER